MPNVSLTRPDGLNVFDWADNVCTDLRNFGVVGALMTADGWQDWGVQLLNNPSLGNALPNPYGFDNWRTWAERLCDSLS